MNTIKVNGGDCHSSFVICHSFTPSAPRRAMARLYIASSSSPAFLNGT
ncbi:hypothetical protein [Coleofasciculus sp. F4-SAH-05]